MSGSSDTKISALPAVSATTGAEILPLVQGGVTKRVPLSQVDVLSEALPTADVLTGDEIAPVIQDSARRRTTVMDQVRLMAAKSAGKVFDTIAAAQALAASLALANGTIIATAAYATPGDGGDGLYEKVVSEPTHLGKFHDGSAWWELKSAITRPEMLGAPGDGSECTAQMQGAANIAVLAGRSAILGLTSGRRYGVTNFQIPNIASSGNGAYLAIVSDGFSFIEGIAGGDSGYLVAPSRWVENSEFGNRRTIFQGIVFDAKSLKDIACVVRGDSWEFHSCRFIGGLSHGMLHTNKDRSGVYTGGSVDCYFTRCDSRGNGGSGFVFDATSVDYQLNNCRGTGNVGWGFDFQGTAGCQITSVNSYGNNSGGLTGCARFLEWGWSSLCMNSLFDGSGVGDVVISSNNGSWTAAWGPNNNVKNANLVCGPLPQKLRILDVQMQGDSSRIVHNDNASTSRQLLISGGHSAANPPIVWNFSSPLGQVYVSPALYCQPINAWYEGRLVPLPNTITSGYAPSKIVPPPKTLVAGTTTTLEISLSVANIQLAGSTIEVDLDIHLLGPASVHVYKGKVRAGFTRRLSLTTKDFWCKTQWESDGDGDGGDVVSAVGAWAVTMSTGAVTPVLTITITHPTPTGSNSFLYTEVRALHRHVTAMSVI